MAYIQPQELFISIAAEGKATSKMNKLINKSKFQDPKTRSKYFGKEYTYLIQFYTTA